MNQPPTLTRREFLIAGAGALASSVGLAAFHYSAELPEAVPTFGGSIVGAASSTGHLLRQGVESFPIATGPEAGEYVPIAIVGGGMAALTAAWQLRRRGQHQFRILELEDHLGGNSSWGQNDVSAYPWGAHYVPVLNDETTHLVPLFEELGIIQGRAAATTESGAPLTEGASATTHSAGSDGGAGTHSGGFIYNEDYLCFAPQERLFLRGRWREGLEPRLGYVSTAPDGTNLGTAADEERQFTDFHNAMEGYRLAVGSDGRRAFAIPLDLSSEDAAFRDLDRISMAELMRQRGWTATALHWYVNYSCRDDYGITVEHTSAWAGIHYFASRSAHIANGDPHLVLTWPEGNGWLVRRLREKVEAVSTGTEAGAAETAEGKGPKRIQTGALVYNIAEEGDEEVRAHAQQPGAADASTADASVPRPLSPSGPLSPSPARKPRWRIDYLDVATKTRRALRANAVIVATPRFIATRIVQALRPPAPAVSAAPASPSGTPPPSPSSFTYAPWMVANITLQGAPEGVGSHLAWDNVIYTSDSLGYVMATHQRLDRYIPRTVMTYYQPLSAGPPAEERTRALARPWAAWRDDILADLSRAHPGIAQNILHMDIWLWGHGMIRPVPGFLWGGARHAAAQSPAPGLAFAHADYSGISIFEEASWHGIRSADAVADFLAVNAQKVAAAPS